MTASSKKPFPVKMNFYLSTIQKRQIERKAFRERRTESDIIREALASLFAKQPAPAPASAP